MAGTLLEKLAGRAAGPEASDPTAERVLAAALAHFEDFGIRRTTVEDIARRAHMSRVTIYRRFPQKERLIEAVILRECRRFFAAVEAAVARYDDPEARSVEGFVFTLHAVREHRLLARLLRTEPELLLPYLTTEGGVFIGACRTFLAGQLRQAQSEFSLPPLQADAVAELVTRLILSFLLTPDSAIPLRTEAEMRRFARRYVAPLMTGAGVA